MAGSVACRNHIVMSARITPCICNIRAIYARVDMWRAWRALRTYRQCDIPPRKHTFCPIRAPHNTHAPCVRKSGKWRRRDTLTHNILGINNPTFYHQRPDSIRHLQHYRSQHTQILLGCGMVVSVVCYNNGFVLGVVQSSQSHKSVLYTLISKYMARWCLASCFIQKSTHICHNNTCLCCDMSVRKTEYTRNILPSAVGCALTYWV